MYVTFSVVSMGAILPRDELDQVCHGVNGTLDTVSWLPCRSLLAGNYVYIYKLPPRPLAMLEVEVYGTNLGEIILW